MKIKEEILTEEKLGFDLKGIVSQKLLGYHDFITAIVTALESRDLYTEFHSMRVADMSQQICCFLGIDSGFSEIVHIAAHVHDIGKIGISDSVLLKTGSLTDSEWQEMKKHPVIGYSILSKVSGFSEISEIVLHHHERWDGTGYPDGLCGIEIPLGSRIIAVADSIDAMMSSRTYRQGMSAQRCREEIERNIGTMYDYDIAVCVLEHWNMIVEVRNDFNSFSQVKKYGTGIFHSDG